ncbi:MAG: ribonuclease P protein component [Bacteroidales bacterium]|nr:ribonuclease P protein component [Bacteroidales bacterium]
MNSQHTFKKGERLSSQKEIDLLFNEGFSYMAYPLRIVFVGNKPFSDMPAAVLVSVPKKRFKHAVTRNRIKRLIREAYRLNKLSFLQFLEQKDKGALIAFIYVGKDVCSYKDMEGAMKKALNTLQDKLS